MTTTKERAAEQWNELRRRAEAVLASRDAREFPAFRQDLLRAARASNIPVDVARDDPHVFLDAPAKLAGATWAQCGGVLRKLLKRGAPLQPALLLGVIDRVEQLLPNHR